MLFDQNDDDDDDDEHADPHGHRFRSYDRLPVTPDSFVRTCTATVRLRDAKRPFRRRVGRTP